MNTNRIVAVALAVLVVTTGAVAAMPTEQSADNVNDAADTGDDTHAGDDVADQHREAENGTEMNAAEDEEEHDEADEYETENETEHHEADEYETENETEHHEADEYETENETEDEAGNDSAPAAASNADERGPPEDMPAAVPDQVSEIHDAINSFLSGDTDGSLGDALSGLLGGGDDAAASEDGSANASADGASNDVAPAPAGA